MTNRANRELTEYEIQSRIQEAKELVEQEDEEQEDGRLSSRGLCPYVARKIQLEALQNYKV